MAFLGQDTYLEQDRYYHAILIFRTGTAPSTKVVSDLFTQNNVWWWDLGGGEDAARGLEWRSGYLKNVGANVRPRLMAPPLGAVLVAVENTDVSFAVEALLAVLEKVAAVGPAGVDPTEGATMAAQERLEPNAQYAISADWGKSNAPSEDAIQGALGGLGIEVVSVDCGSLNPLEDTGNPFGDIITYYKDYPAVASFYIKYAGTAPPTAKQVRTALRASAVYIPRTPTYGIVDAYVAAKSCALLEAASHMCFLGSRTAYAAVTTIDELLPENPKKWIKILIGVSLGLGALYVGYRVYHSGWARREQERMVKRAYRKASR